MRHIFLPSRLDINLCVASHVSATVFHALCHVSLIDSNVWRIYCLLLVQHAPNGDQIVIEIFCNKTKHLSIECTREGGWEVFGFIKKTSYGIEKCIYSTYSPMSSTRLWLRCSNFFNPLEKKNFGCAANRKSTTTYTNDIVIDECEITQCKREPVAEVLRTEGGGQSVLKYARIYTSLLWIQSVDCIIGVEAVCTFPVAN
jgi:hypothetical protein